MHIGIWGVSVCFWVDVVTGEQCYFEGGQLNLCEGDVQLAWTCKGMLK